MLEALTNQTITLLIFLSVGYAATKGNILTDVVAQGMSSFVVNVTIPALILSTVGSGTPAGMGKTVLLMLASAVVYYAAGIAFFSGIGKLMKFDKKKNALMVNLTVMGNVAFVGLPIITIFVPETGVFTASFFILTFNLIQYTYGVSAMSGVRSFSVRSLITNTTFIAVVIAVLLMVLKWSLPTVLANSFSVIGGLCTPLGFFVLGNMLAGMKLRDVFNQPAAYLIAAIRMLVIPTAVFFAVRLLSFPRDAATVLVILSGVACAMSTSLFAKLYDNHPPFATATVLLTSILFLPCSFYLAFLISKL